MRAAPKDCELSATARRHVLRGYVREGPRQPFHDMVERHLFFRRVHRASILQAPAVDNTPVGRRRHVRVFVSHQRCPARRFSWARTGAYGRRVSTAVRVAKARLLLLIAMLTAITKQPVMGTR
jgi:hypothetical protein